MIVYVMPHNEENWAVKREHEEEPVSVFDSKSEAIETAKEIAMGHDAEMVILRKDGTIENLGTESVDPFPSRDNAPEFNQDADEGNI